MVYLRELAHDVLALVVEPARGDRVDLDPPLRGDVHLLRVVGVVGVVEVRRRVGDEEHELDRVVAAPRRLVERVVEPGIEAFGGVAAAVGDDTTAAPR